MLTRSLPPHALPRALSQLLFGPGAGDAAAAAAAAAFGTGAGAGGLDGGFAARSVLDVLLNGATQVSARSGAARRLPHDADTLPDPLVSRLPTQSAAEAAGASSASAAAMLAATIRAVGKDAPASTPSPSSTPPPTTTQDPLDWALLDGDAITGNASGADFLAGSDWRIQVSRARAAKVELARKGISARSARPAHAPLLPASQVASLPAVVWALRDACAARMGVGSSPPTPPSPAASASASLARCFDPPLSLLRAQAAGVAPVVGAQWALFQTQVRGARARSTEAPERGLQGRPRSLAPSLSFPPSLTSSPLHSPSSSAPSTRRTSRPQSTRCSGAW